MSKKTHKSIQPATPGHCRDKGLDFEIDDGCFKALFESSRDGLVYTNAEDVILKVNPAFCDIIGYSAKALIGKTPQHFTPPEKRESEQQLVRHMIQKNQKRKELETECIHADGHRVQVKVSFWDCENNAHRLGGTWRTIRDISAQKKAELEADQSFERYRFMAENTDDVIWMLNPDLVYSYVSPSVERLRGFAPRELIGTTCTESMTPASKATLMDAYETARREALSGNDFTFSRLELEILCKDGSTVWVESVIKTLWASSGTWLGSVGSSRDITDRREMEGRLKKSQDAVRALLDAITEPVGLFELEGTILAANQTLAEILGRSKKNVIGCNVFDFMPEMLAKEVQAGFAKAKTAQRPIAKDTVWGNRMLESVIYPVVDDNDITTIAVYARDVTNTRYAEAARKKIQEQYRLIVETANEGVVGLDTDWRITYVNDIMANFLGYDAIDIIGQRYTHFLLSEELEAFGTHAKEVMHGKRDRYERRFIRKDGSIVWGLVSASPLSSEKAEHLGAFAMVADITEVKQAHQRLLTILDGISANIYVSDLETNEILFMNAHMKNRFGPYDKNTPCHKHICGRDTVCDDCAKPRILNEKGEPQGPVITERYKDAYKEWSLNYDRAIEWIQGKLVHMHMGTDITELKTMAVELGHAMVDARAASLAKNEFLANMSHEIRTPLNGVLGMMQLLQLSDLEPTQREYLDTALTSGRNLLQILNDILDLSKVESGKLELEESAFELGEMLDSVIGTFRLDVEERGLDMDWIIDPDLPRHFMADKGRLRQILFNLVGNAAKFTDHGSIRVEAYPLMNTLTEDTLSIFFEVTDTGIGIPPHKIKDVFDPFTQADGSTTRKYQGTGLGLGIVHRLVSLMNGTLHVSSRLNEGTTILFTIRACPLAKPIHSAAMALKTIPQQRLSVLVAEDEHVNRVVVERLLKKFGHTPFCVDSGEKAIEALRKEQFDLFLTDIQMPGLDGVETTRVIREEMDISIPIIALTAHAMKGDKRRFMEAGMNGYIAKPFDMEKLRKEIKRVMAEATILTD
ncbi:PAS domain S-box protein [Pseudodesulfovibrio sp. JC047]|uniref:PAS domain-containing hybrid sensor histidine kinase/response regulator n=1 Tax=Pseudodesulfovibrio sp. JC047 TaxID=2683199 RepID=UPI0013D40B03|nr:PAS domain S-box protein [Pseudodesulfovibrio sp. JC047]NDV20478.1 PAS domain S-box protein [Pseudodesulfovibrio sp. JC047]